MRVHTERERKVFKNDVCQTNGWKNRADNTIDTMIKIFKTIKDITKSPTLDNGTEFTKHYDANYKIRNKNIFC
jgi:IS30 family transposase